MNQLGHLHMQIRSLVIKIKKLCDHNGNKFYNFLCYPRLFRQYVHVIFIIIIYIFVCSYYVLIIRTVRFCQINQIKKKAVKSV